MTTSFSASLPRLESRLEDVLSFWFVAHGPEDWFAKSNEFDRIIQDRFEDLLVVLSEEPQGALQMAKASARNALAVLIVLDQFSRNLYRGHAKAFAQDAQARDIARHSIALSHHIDAALPRGGTLFFLMPFEHSEEMADQEWACALIPALMGPDYGEYAQKHRDVIRRFGRFPHRNAALGRKTTQEEQIFIDMPGTGF